MSSTMSAVLSAARNVTDPLRAYNFRIALIDSSSAGAGIGSALGFVMGGFSECTGLEATMQIEDYIEGGENSFVHRFPTRATYGNVTLENTLYGRLDSLRDELASDISRVLFGAGA